jgi:hypothetical protein
MMSGFDANELKQDSTGSSFWDNTDNPLFGLDAAVQPMPESLLDDPQFSSTSILAHGNTSDNSTATVAQNGSSNKKRQRLLATSTAVDEQSNRLRRRRKTRKLPQVLSGKDALAAKYPQEIKQALSTCLQGKLECDIHEQIRAAVRRPALLNLTSYWYVAWHFVRCYVVNWPLICLPRCEALIKQLLAAQQIFMQQFPQIMHEQSIEQQNREQYRLKPVAAVATTSSSIVSAALSSSSATKDVVSRYDNVHNDAMSTIRSNVESDKSGFENSVVESSAESSVEKARQLFLNCCKAARISFAVDSNVAAFVAEQQQRNNSTEEVAYRQTMFECFAMFILAVAERGGDIYLKRSSVNGYIVELCRARDLFERNVASFHLGFASDDIAAGRRFDATTNQISDASRLGRSISHNDVRVAHGQISAVFDLIDKK